MAAKNASDADEKKVDDLERVRIKRKKRKKNRKLKIMFMIIVGAAVVLITFFTIFNMTYGSYKIEESWSRESDTNTEFVPYNNGYIRYGSSGAAFVTSAGEQQWNVSYSMQNPTIHQKDNNLVIGDVGGNTVVMLNEKGEVGRINTEYNILNVEAASTGIVGVVMQSNADNYINMYGSDSSLIYSIRTNITGDGYPVDIAISNDSTKLIVAYAKTSESNVVSNLVFYNFSGDANSKDSRVVGAYSDFDGKLVGHVAFLSNNTAIAVSEDSLRYYTVGATPSAGEKIALDSKIQNVFYTSGNVGIVSETGNEDDPYNIKIFNSNGGKLSDVNYDTTYTTYNFDGNTVLMYGGSNFAIMNLSGKFVTKQTIDGTVTAFISTGKRGKYYLVDDRFISRVRLT